MLKHVGTHNNRKVAILYHQVPGEDHMCLLVYSDLLPRMIHDQIMTTIESAPGQQATNLADALFRNIMADGRNALEVIHKEGFMKKVQTSQVIMTPTPSQTIRLDELNNLLTEMAKGDDAKKRLAEADASTGIQSKKRDNTPQRNVGEPQKTTSAAVAPLQAGPNEVLSDEAIANQRRAQAAKMRDEATALLAESARLESEAAQLMPAPVAPSVETATEANAPA
jgi:hypothetical protein